MDFLPNDLGLIELRSDWGQQAWPRFDENPLCTASCSYKIYRSNMKLSIDDFCGYEMLSVVSLTSPIFLKACGMLFAITSVFGRKHILPGISWNLTPQCVLVGENMSWGRNEEKEWPRILRTKKSCLNIGKSEKKHRLWFDTFSLSWQNPSFYHWE